MKSHYTKRAKNSTFVDQSFKENNQTLLITLVRYKQLCVSFFTPQREDFRITVIYFIKLKLLVTRKMTKLQLLRTTAGVLLVKY